jgi:hypothetical protein
MTPTATIQRLIIPIITAIAEPDVTPTACELLDVYSFELKPLLLHCGPENLLAALGERLQGRRLGYVLSPLCYSHDSAAVHDRKRCEQN